MMDALPVIDLAGGTFTDGAELARISSQIGRACREIGFFYVTNHGVAADLVAAVFARSADFFALPRGEKDSLAIQRVGNNRGYVGLKTEALDPKRGGDLKEAFNVGYEPELDPDHVPGPAAVPQNAWPVIPDFRQSVGDYYRACLTLGRRLHLAISADLGLSPDYFADKLNRPMAVLRLLHYPEREGAVADLGAGEHTDYGNLTLLATDAVGGLEVRRRDGTWLSAPSLPGAFIVNIGDCLMRWTNDIYVSTPHRVVAPAGRQRYSIAFFLDPNADAVVAALPGTIALGEIAKYAATTGMGHISERLNATYGLAKVPAA